MTKSNIPVFAIVGGCEEAVNWVVFKTPLAIHEDNLRDLQTMRNKKNETIKNNFRESQDRNDRFGEGLLTFSSCS